MFGAPHRHPRADAKSDPRVSQSKAIDAEIEKLWDTFRALTKPYGEFDHPSDFYAYIAEAQAVETKVEELSVLSDSLMEKQNEIVEELIADYPEENSLTFTDGYSGLGDVDTII
jgi:hypothetical protein